MADVVLQQFVMPSRRSPSRLYYRSKQTGPPPERSGRHGAILSRGSLLHTGTYFNAFFEDYWRTYTALGRLDLRLRTSGAGTVRILRRRASGKRQLLVTADCVGDDREVNLPVPDSASDRGILLVEVRARSARFVLHAADWIARDVAPRPIRLVIGYCTFDREEALSANLRALLADKSLPDVLERIVVVDQGTRRIRNHPEFARLSSRAGGRIALFEQENRGGAGGFTRCILAALDDPSATHVLLTDDDAIIEPESVRRAGMFLALGRQELAVAGQLLDLRRPHELVDVGGAYDAGRVAVAPAVRRRVDRRCGLSAIQTAKAQQCSGWWFFAFPLNAIRTVGLPLPLFLRGDDAEFGVRLTTAGIPSVPLPGVAVRHEAIDRARRHWQEYYDLRNMLAVGAVHFGLTRRAVLRRFSAGVSGALLGYRYDTAWLLCEAARDYLRGPCSLERPAQVGHAALLAKWKSLMPQSRPAGDGELTQPGLKPGRRIARLLNAARRIWHNLIMPDPGSDVAPERTLPESVSDWHAIGNAEVVTIRGDEGREWLLRRSRWQFLGLSLRAAWLWLRLRIEHGRVANRWRRYARTLTSDKFWREYLDIAENHPVETGVGSFSPAVTDVPVRRREHLAAGQ